MIARDAERNHRRSHEFRIALALCKSRASEQASASERRGASLVSPGALSPFHGLRSCRKKRPPLAVTVCRQNLPFHLAFSTCENKSLSRFSYRSGERPQEWERLGGEGESGGGWVGGWVGRGEKAQSG